MGSDIRHAIRGLFRNPGFTTVALLTIALGIGPTAAVFSIIQAVLLRPLPLGEPDRMIAIWETMKSRGLDQVAVSGPSLLDWQREARSFTAIMPGQASPELGFNLTLGGEPERVLGARAGANLLEVFGIAPEAGRGFRPEEGRPGGPRAALISDQLWRRRFGADPAAISRSIGLDGVSYTVVGVLPADLRSIGSIDVWVPVTDDLAHLPRSDHRYGVLARLKKGVTLRQAQAEMDEICARLARRYPDTNTGVGAVVLSVNGMIGAARPAFSLLFAAVLVLLLIACANVAGLLLARGSARGREIAVRAALGASSLRIARQLLVESAVLALAGGLVGLLLAGWSIAALRNALPDVIPRLKEMGIDRSVFAFTLLASVGAGPLCGILPALRISRAHIGHALQRGGGRGDTGQGARNLLLVAEVALAVVLLAGAGLLVRSFLKLVSVDPGFQPGHVLSMRLTLPHSRYPDPGRRALFTRSMLARVSDLPGVRAAGTVNFLPMRTYFLTLPAFTRPYEIEGQLPLPAAEQPNADYRIVSPGFLRAMGVTLLEGRDFSGHDQADSPLAALVNQTLARRCCSGQIAIGRHIRIAGQSREIVGVVPDIRLSGLDGAVRPAVYIPNEQDPVEGFSLVVRATPEAGPYASVAAAVRGAILAEDADQPVADLLPMEQVVANALLLRRLSMSLLAVFAALALVLAAVGIYALTAHSVSRRTSEIGLRMALGAGRSQILRLMVARGLGVGSAGLAIGLPAAFALPRIMRGMLFGIAPFDPVVFLGVPLVLLAIALAASYIPARKAARVDPVVALRHN